MPIRMALVRLPQLLRDVVASAFSADDVSFEWFANEADVTLGATSKELHADVVIAQVDDPWQAEVGQFLTRSPALVVLGIRDDGRSAWIYEMVPRPRPLGELGLVELRATVLGALGAST
jgi:hypothetical protein